MPDDKYLVVRWPDGATEVVLSRQYTDPDLADYFNGAVVLYGIKGKRRG